MMTTHGQTYHDIQKRPILRDILGLQVFDRYIELKRSSRPGVVSAVRDGRGTILSNHEGVFHD
jgi:stage III sporulation protein AA